MVQERTTERRLEEVVCDDVLRRPGRVQVAVHGQPLGPVGAHGQADRVGAGHVAVLGTVVELVLLLVETVRQVARAPAWVTAALRDPVRRRGPGLRAGGVLRADEVVDPERLVREVAARAVRTLSWSAA